jgi:cytochrome c
MSLRHKIGWLASLVVVLYGATAMAAGDASRGAQAFQQCAACHSVEPGRHLTGPSLAHVWGRKAGTAEGFDRYSDALQRSGVVWNEDSLNKWLTNPQAFVSGNSMGFPGLKKASTRDDVIAYLKAVSEGKAPSGPAGGGMMGGMMGNSGPANLRQASTDSLVTSLRHCRDTYIIKTAAGATRKVWEYNVRLKTDSSKHGPNPGKPVMTGSGMQGDRVSIVFASPSEVSEFIKESCQ